ncbi:site-specific DNA-methyltransferase [Burkholderia vietnamiensis]|uniref:site-specific DNA-methyltransferase n=1 Tax=Burkholderia vietnamiensis TaxID=60552 RepID=UPI001B90A247|nr:site-specific DNA-methyltransferase [Burkholderia vietnamiensis]MBR8036671.1 site-specific DNA-methyltransferase [Burkholderia vietnamiensis]
MKKQRLELTWIGKDHHPHLEPRILIEDVNLSYHAGHRVSEEDRFDNLLIFGDNLLALKSLESSFAGQVKCVYIDPPFNTQQAFELYDDGVEHSLWLSLMRDRLEAIYRLISDEGTLFVHIDDNELGYLIVLLDEIFGRTNRVSIITFKQGAATGHKSINPGVVSTSNYILVYAKNKNLWKPNRLYSVRTERDTRYNQYIENIDAPFKQWTFTTLTRAFAQDLQMPEKGIKKALGEEYEQRVSEFVMKNATRVVRLARPDYKAVSAEARGMIDQSKKTPGEVLLLERESHSNMYFVDGERILFYSDKLKLIDGEYVAGEPLTTIWDDLLSNNLHNEGAVDFPKGKKPEALIKRCIELVTQPGDLVLDSFAGSGTTGAVAHKMRRRWIMIELREHCHTHIIPRLKAVIDGSDKSGVTSSAGWAGGGGFRYCKLAPSLLEKDKWGNWIIQSDYNPTMLAEAVCKLMGFTYAPSENSYWMHGYSSERDFIYVTTQSLTRDQLRAISEEVGDERSLLVCCKAFNAKPDAFLNLTIKKIPLAVLRKCEWGRDDYSLTVQNLPEAKAESSDAPITPATKRRVSKAQADLFAEKE